MVMAQAENTPKKNPKKQNKTKQKTQPPNPKIMEDNDVFNIGHKICYQDVDCPKGSWNSDLEHRRQTIYYLIETMEVNVFIQIYRGWGGGHVEIITVKGQLDEKPVKWIKKSER